MVSIDLAQNVMICGKIVITTTVTKTGIKNGNTPLVTVETDISS